MEEDLFPHEPVAKLYAPHSIAIGTFLGGPLVAGYLMAENFKNINQPQKVGISWALGIAVTILALALALFVPGIEKIPGFIIPLFYAFISHVLAKEIQGTAVSTHQELGGLMHSSWRAAGIGMIGALVTVAIVFVVFWIGGERLKF